MKHERVLAVTITGKQDPAHTVVDTVLWEDSPGIQIKMIQFHSL